MKPALATSDRRLHRTALLARRVRDLSARLVGVQEQERRRLSEALHDRAGANLAAVNLNLAIIARNLAAHDAEGLALLQETRALVADTVVSLREFGSELRPALLAHAGLLPALEQCLHQFGLRAGCSASLDHSNYSGPCRPEVEALLYRIVQEALLNCRKHAAATRVRVSLSGTPDQLSLVVQDNGCGFEPGLLGRTGTPLGQGLLDMRERAASLGGHCQVNSQPGQGTTVTIRLTAT